MTDRPKVKVVRSTDAGGEGVVVNVPGNHFDKHGSNNPIVRRMMTTFHDTLVELVSSVGPRSALDVGCGEGLTTGILTERVAVETLIGCDLEVSAVSQGPGNAEGARFLAASVYDLPFADDAFDLVVATEVLEHLDDPGGALSELGRVASAAVIITVPNEPWWRMGNMARGKYLRDLGNTPGHVQHWSTTSFQRFVESRFGAVDVRRAAMWNMAIARL